MRPWTHGRREVSVYRPVLSKQDVNATQGFRGFSPVPQIMECIVVVQLVPRTLCARTHGLRGLKASETMDLSQGHGARLTTEVLFFRRHSRHLRSSQYEVHWNHCGRAQTLLVLAGSGCGRQASWWNSPAV